RQSRRTAQQGPRAAGPPPRRPEQMSDAGGEMTESSGATVRTVAILGGTGNLGRGMAVRLAKAGHRVVIGSRDADRAAASATEVAQLTGSTEVTGSDNGDAADGADVVLVAVPFANQAK